MPQTHETLVATELGLPTRSVAATAALLDGGATVPFIARYRKEATGSLDEVVITRIRDRVAQLRKLDERRQSILSSLAERGVLSDELENAVRDAPTLTALEDVYLPYRPKRRTRAAIAREKGLEPLADTIFEQAMAGSLQQEAARYIDADRGVADVEAALAGARDIVAETVSEDAEARAEIRALFEHRAMVHSRVVKGRETDGATYRDYFDWQEPLARIAGHRIHALLRAEREGVIRLSIRPEEETACAYLVERFVTDQGEASAQVAEAAQDAYKRLIAPSIENEFRSALKERADGEAIRVFASNLKDLLMAPPLGQKRVLAIDPGHRTGGKVVCLDTQGQLLTHAVIYPTGSDGQRAEAARVLKDLVKQFAVDAIAIGNGTAGRETEHFVRGLDLGRRIDVILVNESGASVYSASAIAREEFPDHDITVRGAASIGRRLMDPLSELVKIDPRSIGVGQYQHDVDSGLLQQSLDDVVETCVNAVGVELNTASRPLLTRVSGVGPKLAENILAYRRDHGPFGTRDELRHVPRLGEKAFEQAAGFLRIRDSEDPLDASAVHPERYALVRRMAADLGCSVRDLMRDETLRDAIDVQRYVSDDVGLPTLTDIVSELARPGRDPRPRFSGFSFDSRVHEIVDLEPGMVLPGMVTNVVDFGAFVDVGVHQDGLVHVSQLADRYVEHPSHVVRVGQTVVVRVLEVDVDRRRIALSMRSAGPAA